VFHFLSQIVFFIGVLKLLAIGITVASGWPGGIIFPLFFAGAALGYSVEWFNNGPFLSLVLSCMMVGLEASITRTPWASSIVILLLQRLPNTTGNHILQVFGPVTIAVYVAIFLTRKFRFYSSDIQHGRNDVIILQLDDNSADKTKSDEPEDDEVSDAMKIGKDKDLPDMVGFLEKKGSLGLVQLWRKRWFVKRGNVIFYYSEKMPNSVTKLHKDLKLHLGAIEIQEVVDAKSLPDIDENTFMVSLTNRSYYLRAENPDEKNAWIRAFQGLDKKSIEISTTE